MNWCAAAETMTALALLRSDDYQSQKVLYSDGMDRFRPNPSHATLIDKNSAEFGAIKLSLSAALVATVAVIVLWGVIIRLLYGQQRRLALLNRELERANRRQVRFSCLHES